jgi:hypothetical protein
MSPCSIVREDVGTHDAYGGVKVYLLYFACAQEHNDFFFEVGICLLFFGNRRNLPRISDSQS